MTINWEKVKQYRKNHGQGVGKTFCMLLEAAEFIRDNPGKSVAIICRSSAVIHGMKNEFRSIAQELHLGDCEETHEMFFFKENSNVFFTIAGALGRQEKDAVFVDHDAVQSMVRWC